MLFLLYQITNTLALNLFSPVIDEPRDISKSSRINYIMSLSFNQSAHIVNMIINVIEITAVFFAISGICHRPTKSIKDKKHQLTK